jgi:hypothetical protein
VRVMRLMKRALDPHNLMNPGKIVAPRQVRAGSLEFSHLRSGR